ncbi:MAG: cytochrome c3 family protein [Thermodesulfobacteriota bacterium]
MRRAAPVLILAALVLATPQLAPATPGLQKLFVAHYPKAKGGALDSCTTCHMPAAKDFLNAYGLVLKEKAMDFAAAEGGDADGDGKTSGEEIATGGWPGSQAQALELFVFTNKRGTITFDHERHSTVPAYLPAGKCDTCHGPELFPRLFDDAVSVKEIAHSRCLGCHKDAKGSRAPGKCAGCHGDKGRE